MNPILKKSRYHKQSTKSGNEDNNSPEEELKKYRELIEKLGYTCQKNKSKDLSGAHYSDSPMEPSNINISSNIRRTTSRTKEAFNDRDFLINFMNDDTMPILPRNMHLLTDDDTNQNIDDKTKFKNLADLLLDDKETIIESYFIKKVEDKMILKLYTALSRKSKDIFMEENNENKDKNRILMHKLNNIEIPKFKFIEKDALNNNDNGNTINLKLNEEKDNLDEQYDEVIEGENTILKKILKRSKNNLPIQKDNEIPLNNNININNSTNKNMNININTSANASKRNSLIKSQNDLYEKYIKEKPHFHPRCKYNKKNNKLRIVKLPTLENFVPVRPNKIHNRKSRKAIPVFQPQKFEQWEPDIDGDLLSYINHNIVKIEDIYNKGKENVFELKENLDEEVKPIEAKEVFFDINQNNNEDNSENNNNKNKSIDNNNYQSKKTLSNISEDDDLELKNKNKFCEYKDRLPNLIEITLAVEPEKKKISDFHKELQELYANRINEVGELEEEVFPSFGKDLKSIKIYKFAMNNERNEEINTDSFTLFGESTNVSKSHKSGKSKKKKLKLDLGSGDNSRKKEESSKSNSSNEDSVNNKENSQKNENMSDSKENQNEEEKNNSGKSNIIYDDTNNLYSLESNNEFNDDNQVNNNNFENDESNKKDEDEENNNNINNKDIKENSNDNNNVNNNEDHFLKLSFSKNSSN